MADELEVELVQLEQLALLRCLIKDHGLRRIFAEGLTAKDLPNYRERIAALRDMERDQIPEFREQLMRVQELSSAQARRVESEIVGMLDQHKVRLLQLGAAGRLLIAGEIDEVLPLDDAEPLEQAKRITPATLEARHDAQIRAVLKNGPLALIVLGGAHDLSDSVSAAGRRTLRVHPRGDQAVCGGQRVGLAALV
jgi:hypothetical protein